MFCGRQNNTPKDIQVLIPGICDHVTILGKADFVDVIKLRSLRWKDYPGLSGWALYNHKGPSKGKREEESQRCDDMSRGQSMRLLAADHKSGNDGSF